MAKSVDRIVKGLEKLVNQLADCVDGCSTEMVLQKSAIYDAQEKFDVANEERNRAKRIRNKLTELIE